MRGRFLSALALIAVAAVPAACGDDAGPDGGDGGSEGTPVPFGIELAPEFVQGIVTGATTGVLVTIEDETPTDVPVELTVTVDGAPVVPEPASIVAGEVAEVMFAVDVESDGAPVEIVVTGRRGELEATATRSTTGYAWDDDRAEYARTLLDVFLAWLAEHESEIGIGSDTEFAGSFVAPELLVVSHYLFLSDEWELGLSWHVMLPPDDWAEVYLRPRDDLAPMLAFRLLSQEAALQAGEAVITAVAPPAEIVR